MTEDWPNHADYAQEIAALERRHRELLAAANTIADWNTQLIDRGDRMATYIQTVYASKPQVVVDWLAISHGKEGTIEWEARNVHLAIAALNSIEYDCHGTALSAPTEKARDEGLEHIAQLEREVIRLRQGLLACATAAGEDVSDGIPTWPDIVEWAVRAVCELRVEYEEALRL